MLDLRTLVRDLFDIFYQHPIELVKTRMQLQGELTQTYTKTYSKNLESARLIIKNDGFRGLFGGLKAGLSYQIIMNGRVQKKMK